MATEKYTLRDLVAGLAVRSKIEPSQTEAFIRAFTDTIMDGLNRDMMVKIKGLGTFKLITVESRESVNVNTGERILIEGHSKVSFTPDPVLRDEINKPFADFQTVVLNEDMDMAAIGKEVEEPAEEAPAAAEPDAPAENIKPVENAEPDAPTVPAEPFVHFEQIERVELDEEPIASAPIEESEEPEAPETTESPIAPVAAPSRRSSWCTVLWTLFVILLCALSYAAGYFRWGIPADTEECAVEEPIAEAVVEEAPAEEPEQAVADTTHYPQVEGAEYRIVGVKETHVLGRGESLRHVSIKYFGTKDFVPYIIALNEITNPDVVPVGKKLQIPELQEVAQ